MLDREDKNFLQTKQTYKPFIFESICILKSTT